MFGTSVIKRNKAPSRPAGRSGGLDEASEVARMVAEAAERLEMHPSLHRRPFVEPRPVARRRLWERERAMLAASDRIGTLQGLKPRPQHRLFDRMLAIGGGALKLLGLHGRGLGNVLAVERVELELEFAGLPAEFDGYRILHITDPHFDVAEGVGSAIVRAIRDVEADLCVLTGDYRVHSSGPFVQVLRPLTLVLEAVRAKDGILATLGNHDDHLMARAFEAIGLAVMTNETAVIRRGAASLHLTGLDDVHQHYTLAAEAALDLPGDVFGIALVHSPEMAEAAARAGYALYLTGHTHGGQICLPGGRPVMTRMDGHRNLAVGLWRCGDMQGYTSRGAGASGIPIRFFSRSEVTLVTLRRRAPKSRS